MKKIITCSAVALFTATAFSQTVEDANVLLGNLSGSLYWESYDDNTKIVDNLNFSVYADGTNSDYVTPPFTIKVYIWDGSNPTFVHTFNDPGIHHFGGRDYVDQDIDLSDLALPAGSYRLGVFVDADDDISDSDDDPSDNAYLAPDDINFTPGGGSAGIGEQSVLNTLMVFPNPVADKVTIAWENADAQAETLEIRDMNGRVVRSVALSGQTCVNLGVADLDKGIYVVAISSEARTSVQKFIKQ